MKEQTKTWLKYADENLRSAKILLESDLFNPCLQNVQQAVEKMLKALLAEWGIKIKKTHSINELVAILNETGLRVDIEEDERDLIDSIYLPSKYPVGSVLPDFEPDVQTCKQCVAIADRLRGSIQALLSQGN
ncbi:MAG: DNA-binding protein [Planctomycetes bacterium RBG_16_55_9]|nr:MAG: DNA-binding protein [Planctomycetes bacterium RBG_16_55_9]